MILGDFYDNYKLHEFIRIVRTPNSIGILTHNYTFLCTKT